MEVEQIKKYSKLNTVFRWVKRQDLRAGLCSTSSPGVPNLGYICLSKGVHLRLAEDEKNIFTCYLFPNVQQVATSATGR